ncbi:MAG: S9 family peptidase [Chlorobiaceae bacterium]|nr:S9 family peptidase [Chlorobiaceae bacterium]
MIKLRKALLPIASALLLFLSCNASADQPLSPPPQSIIVDQYYGVPIPDPFQPLENLDDPQVKKWITEQSAHARSVLESIPGRRELISKMRQFDDRRPSKVYSLSITDNDRYFYLKEIPGDEVGKLFFRDGFEGRETLLFDPASFSGTGGGKFVITNFAASDKGSKVAISLSPNGSENSILVIMDVTSGKLLPEQIDRCRFASPSWLPDEKAFLYNRMKKVTTPGQNPQNDSKVFLHLLGTDPDLDREVFSKTTNPELRIKSEDIPGIDYSDKSGYLFAFVSNVDRRLTVYYAPQQELFGNRISWKPLFLPENDIHDFAVNRSDIYYFTPKNAPRFKLMKTSLVRPDFLHAETVVPENPSARLTAFALTKDGVYFTQSTNGVTAKLFRQNYGSRSPVELKTPFNPGTIALFSKGFLYPDVWAVMGGWNNDFKRYRYDPAKNEFRKETLSSPAEYPEYGNLVVEEVMVPSHDKVPVPLSLVYMPSLKKDGKNPAFIYGYGAYGKAITPFFSPGLLLWTAKGGVLAIAHVRGGGEQGDAWHTGGMKSTKPNTWKDLISCALYLEEKGFTGSGRIAINAASAGGILVGRAMTERPDLFAAVISQVGLMNPLRGELTPNGPVNVPEFGSVTKKDECMALMEMDPYLNVEDGVSYPATLVTAGLNDPRVIAWQPAKFAARLASATASGKPVLFFADGDAGHGIGNTKTKDFESLADVLSFGLWQTGHPEFQVK